MHTHALLGVVVCIILCKQVGNKTYIINPNKILNDIYRRDLDWN